MNLHELPQINGQAGNGQSIQSGQPDRQKALFPMSPVLSENVFYIVLIDQDVAFQDMSKRSTTFRAIYDYLLVTQRDLRIRDNERRNKSMGFMTGFTPEPLDRESDSDGKGHDRTLIVTMSDEMSGFIAGALKPVDREVIDHLIIYILR